MMFPAHWWFSGPQRSARMRPTTEIFRRVDVPGAHLASFRRLLRFGPWAIYLGRYRPGNVDKYGGV